MKRYSYIDALRGYAVLGVLLVHCGQESGFAGAPVSAGARGVQLFFVVSALTLLMSWRNREDGVPAFFIRRSFRILPMFWLSIPLYLYTPINEQIIAAALLLQAARPEWLFAPVVPGGWSVCAEAAFYIFFPVIALLVTSLRRAIILMVASLIIARLWRQTGIYWLPNLFPEATRDEVFNFIAFTFPSQLPAFAAGIACFFFLPVVQRLNRAWIELALATSIVAIIMLAVYREHDFASFSAAFAFAAACLANGSGKYLLNPIIEHIGRCSFSIYLLQWKAIAPAHSLADHFSGSERFVALFIVSAIIVTAFSTITYYLIERPMIMIGNNIIRRCLGPVFRRQQAGVLGAAER